MQTQKHYGALAKQVRKYILDKKPIPQDYQEVIEEFLPMEEKYPDRRIITVYEYPDSNPELLLENKRGFRLQFVLVFLSNEQSAGFCQEIMNNGQLKWQVARFFLEVVENVVFVKTRGQTIQNMLQKLEGIIQNQPLCIFHFNLKMRTLLHIIEKGYWSIRIVWGPAHQTPLCGYDVENIKDEKSNFPKFEISNKELDEPEKNSTENMKLEEQTFKQITKTVLQSADFYQKLAESTVAKLRQQNKGT